MSNTAREPVKQSAPGKRSARTHVSQSNSHAAHPKTPAGAGREPVKQSRVNRG